MSDRKQEWATVVVPDHQVARNLEHYTNDPDGRGAWTFWPPVVWAGTIRGEAMFLLTFNRGPAIPAPQDTAQEGEGDA